MDELKEIYKWLEDITLNIDEEETSIEDVFSTLFNMEEEEFLQLAPIFIEEISKTFNNTETKLFLANLANVNGAKYEEMVEAYKEIFESFDEKISSDVLSDSKKDFLKNILSIILNSISDTQAITKRIINIPVEKEQDSKLPTYAHITDAAMDIYAAEDYTLVPGDLVLIKTGLKVAIPKGYALLIQPRSGFSTKSKLRIPNTPGLIDSGYRGEICIPMENIEPNIKDFVLDEDGKATGILYGSAYTIEKGERIAQARLVEVPTVSWTEVSNILDYESDRGEGGFGSTGIK